MNNRTVISDVGILLFDFDERHVEEEEFPLECTFSLTAQNPKDGALLKRAILVEFQAQSAEQQFHLNVMCRVVFSFESSEELKEGKALIEKYQNDALLATVNKTNQVLVAMGKNEINVPKL